MNHERATGVILRTRPLTDTSLIVHWLTAGLGRLATVAKGARRDRSPFRGQLDLFYVADLSFARSRRSELHILREVKLMETHPGLRRDLALLQQASYCALLIEQTTETEAPLGALFDQFTRLLAALPKQPARPQTIFAFEMKLLDGLGLRPKLEETNLSAGARQILGRMAELEWDAVFRMGLSAAQTEEIRQFLHGFLVYHLEKIPRGRSAALGVDGPAGPK
jgi:DNA repair protein RecO (recombination protein O)